MPVAAVARLASGLAFIGRQGTRALAISVFVGLALPPLAAFAKPTFTETLFALLVLSFLRVEPAALVRHATRPALVLAAVAWTMVAVPAVCGAALLAIGLDRTAPALHMTLMLQAMAPPLVSAPAVAALMGLDAALTLAIVVASLAVAPFTATAFAAVFLGSTLSLSPLALGAKTLALVAVAAALAALVRRLAGAAVIARQAEHIDGLSVILMFVFAVAFMDGVPAHVIAAPLAALGLLALTFVVSLVLGAITALVFARAGRATALGLAVTVAMRNCGLMAAAALSAMPDLGWLYFSYAQFPIYLLPNLLAPLARAVTKPKGVKARPG
jgi:hypothetical protein